MNDGDHVPRELELDSQGCRLSALLYLPPVPPRAALLICHGAGSCKENHAVMAQQAVASGLAALVFDFRGHGESSGAMDDGAAYDVIAAADALRREAGTPTVAARGSSMGAFWLLRAAREHPESFSALAALCPADESSLLAGLDHFVALSSAHGQAGDPSTFRARWDVEGLRRLLRGTDLVETARGMSRVMLAHAYDDSDVPFAVSLRLAAVLRPPLRLIAVAEGGHRGPQRSPLVAKATLDWALGDASRPSAAALPGR